MFYVYILRSANHPEQTYIGYTSNLSQRLAKHNTGLCTYTSKYMPWTIVTYTAFTNQIKAIQFEKYLKTSSGKILVNRRLL